MTNHSFTLAGTEPGSKIDVFVLSLTNPPYPQEQLAPLLSPDEHLRAARFFTPSLQNRFRTGRALLRQVLGRAVDNPPQDLVFQYSAEGKPSLRNHPSLHFNVSHSGDLWACAISPTVRVGVDIEQVRQIAEMDQIARRFFAPGECAMLEQIPEAARLPAFFRCWTRKEAYVKGLGKGLSHGLTKFETTDGTGPFTQILDPAQSTPWLAHSFTPLPGFAGAIAIEAAPRPDVH